MTQPTNSAPRRFVRRTGRSVWAFAGPPGYLESIQAAGTIAAPLLAGASFTLVALALQSTTPFARWPDLALLLLTAAGLAQVFAVQSVIWTRQYMANPDELRQWYPDDFTSTEGEPTQWLLNLQAGNEQEARKWADRTRLWINAGISLLLAGIAVSVVPPGPVSPLRWVVITLAWAGVAVEASWVTATMADETVRGGLLLRAASISTAGGATAAAGFAATSRTASGAATWWAVALAVAAALCWLAVVSGVRLRHGRLRPQPAHFGVRQVALAGAALLAPALFLTALGSTVAVLRQSRRQKLAARHRGVETLLPAGVSLGRHHRAWERCQAIPVARPDEADKLLDESVPLLGTGGQPSPSQLRERMARAPGCVVRVTDADDRDDQFGYYIVYPLRAVAVGRITSGQVTTDRQLQPTDIAAAPDDPAGWYVSVIWVPGPRWTRRCVLATLVDALAASGAGSPGRPVFARPATGQGRALLQRYGFTAVGGQEDGIWILEASSAAAGHLP